MKLNNDQWQSLYRYALALCDSMEEALALLHSAVERLTRVKPTKAISPETYLRKVMRNQHFSRLALQENSPQLMPLDQKCTQDIPTQFEDEISLEDILIDRTFSDTWKSLSAEQRDILYLWAWLDFSPQASAEEMNLAKSTFLAKIHQLSSTLQTNHCTEIKASTAP